MQNYLWVVETWNGDEWTPADASYSASAHMTRNEARIEMAWMRKARRLAYTRTPKRRVVKYVREGK